MAVVNISNAPSGLSMDVFKAVSDQFGGLAKSCRFVVRISPQGQLIKQYSGGFEEQLVYLCEAAEYPGRGFLNIDARYYGPNFKLPYQPTYEDITLTFMCRNDSIERLYFDNWMTIINPVNTFDFAYRDDYRSQIDIFHIDDIGEPQYHFSLLDAYPLLVNPQQLTWADDQFLRLGVTFTYSWWTRPGMDPRPRTRSPGAIFLEAASSDPNTI
jgi:hypothetical protein